MQLLWLAPQCRVRCLLHKAHAGLYDNVQWFKCDLLFPAILSVGKSLVFLL